MVPVSPWQVEGRERRLASYEEELKAEQAKRAAEVTSLQRRLKDDAKHAVDLEKQRAKDAEDRAARYAGPEPTDLCATGLGKAYVRIDHTFRVSSCIATPGSRRLVPLTFSVSLSAMLRLERSLASLEKKHGDLQEEYSQYRKDQRKAPTTALHADIAKLKVRGLRGAALVPFLPCTPVPFIPVHTSAIHPLLFPLTRLPTDA